MYSDNFKNSVLVSSSVRGLMMTLNGNDFAWNKAQRSVEGCVGATQQQGSECNERRVQSIHVGVERKRKTLMALFLWVVDGSVRRRRKARATRRCFWRALLSSLLHE
jgi:hypothetical protein